MTPEEFKGALLRIIKQHDAEVAHIETDNLMESLLEELGYAEGIAILRETIRWYAYETRVIPDWAIRYVKEEK